MHPTTDSAGVLRICVIVLVCVCACVHVCKWASLSDVFECTSKCFMSIIYFMLLRTDEPYLLFSLSVDSHSRGSPAAVLLIGV